MELKMEKTILNIWLENTHNHSNNQCVLFFRAGENDIQKIINNLRGIYHVTPITIRNLEESERNLRGMNQIIISDSYETIENMKCVLNNKIIYIEDTNSINKLINLIKNRSFDNTNEIRYELLQKIDFESLFEQMDIKKVVIERLHLLEKINCNFEDMDSDSLIIYLNNYHRNKILFASFAQLLYRLANLDFTSTAKKVGGSIREILGVKSSSISRNRLVDIKTNQLSKGFRVYNLNENTFVTNIKIKIAQELVKLDIKELDVTKISKITELPLTKVEKMYRKVLLN
jgi:hypothetical protein